MAANLAAAGHDVVAYNRTHAKAEAFAAEHGASAVATPRAAAEGSDVVITMLADGPAVRAVYEGDDGVMAGLAEGTVAIDMSTAGPETIAALAAEVAATGAEMVDAPVSGSIAAAEAKTLMIMAGGNAATVEQVRPILEAMGSPVLHVGESGAGATMKLVINSMVFAESQAAAEALVMAERSGVDRAVAYDTICQSAAAAPVIKYRRDWFVHPGEMPVSFTIDLAIKDLDLITGHAKQVGTRLPAAEEAAAVLRAAAEAGMGEGDMGDVAIYMRNEANKS
jgi:3-hydroxyisobutyrate dehydrogenase-like beta-hydroxyacid dehydrogenase